MSNGTRKQWMFIAACNALVVAILLWTRYYQASEGRIFEERREKAERRLEEAINERSLD